MNQNLWGRARIWNHAQQNLVSYEHMFNLHSDWMEQVQRGEDLGCVIGIWALPGHAAWTAPYTWALG